MSKRGGFPGGMGGFGGMNINNLMKQAKQMQADITKTQEDIASKEFTASAGGGAISVKVSGEKTLKEINIKPEVVDPDDVEMLQDLVMAAVNEAIRQIEDLTESEMNKITGGFGGGLGIPGF